jgi:hypothetical protein
MNDAERAEELARAIDSLLHGAGHKQPPETQDDEELTSLLRVANLRAAAGNKKRLVSADHETAVWRTLNKRLENAQDALPDLESEHAEEVVEAIAARRPLYEDEAEGAAAQTEVWERVRQRLEPKQEKEVPRFEGPLFASGDAQLDSLIRAALTRPGVPGAVRDSHVQEQLWARMRRDTRRNAIHEIMAGPQPRGFLAQVTPRVIALAAVLVLTVAALGPLPVTGFADHPMVEATRRVGETLGYTTNAEDPPVTTDNVSVAGVEVTTSEARHLLGLPAVMPAGLPEGYRLISSRYYPAAITAREGGLFATVYAGEGGMSSFNIYQEAASDIELVGRGSPVDTQVVRTPATYFEGGWSLAGGGISWDVAASQTLVFQDEVLRTIIHYSGPRIAPQALLDIANAMAIQTN